MSFIEMSGSYEIENMSKVICFYSKFENADILSSDLKFTQSISRSLFQNCNLKVKLISDINEAQRDFIGFAHIENGFDFLKKNMEKLFNSDKLTVSSGVIFFEGSSHINMYSLHSKINQDIKFVDVKTWKVYENYAINTHNIDNHQAI